MTVPWPGPGLSLTNLPQEPEGQILYPQLDLSVPALDTLIWGLHPDPYFLPDRPAALLEAVSRPHLLGSGRDAWGIGSTGLQDSDRGGAGAVLHAPAARGMLL